MKKSISILIACMLLFTMGVGAVAQAKAVVNPERQAYLAAISDVKLVRQNNAAVISSLKQQNNAQKKANTILQKRVKTRNLGAEARVQLKELNKQIGANKMSILETRIKKLELRLTNKQNAASYNATAAIEVYKGIAQYQTQQIAMLEDNKKCLTSINEIYKAALV